MSTFCIDRSSFALTTEQRVLARQYYRSCRQYMKRGDTKTNIVDTFDRTNVERFSREMTAGYIVRLLAASDPIIEGPGWYHYCALCAASVPLNPIDHEDTCPWRLATEYVNR
jgi:hypothetical protein